MTLGVASSIGYTRINDRYGRRRSIKTIRWVVLGSRLFKARFRGNRAVEKVARSLCHVPKRLPSRRFSPGPNAQHLFFLFLPQPLPQALKEARRKCHPATRITAIKLLYERQRAGGACFR
jgi:hypothetical protein